MNKYKGFSKMWFLVLLLVAVVAGCASNGGDPGTLVSIKVTPTTASIPVSGTMQYLVQAIYGDGSSRDVTAATAFTAGTTGVTMSTTPGLATGVTADPASVVITAKYNGLTNTANLTVNAATSTKFEVTPFGVSPAPLVSIPVTGTQQYTAIETFSNGSTFDRTTLSTWTSSDLGGSGVATISTTGLATGVTIGKSTITAKYNGLTNTAILTVNAATSVLLTVTPDLASIPVTGTQQYKAIEIFSDGSTFDRTTLSTWTSASPGVATFASSIPATGIATGVAVGTSNVTATFGGKTTTPAARLTVTSAKVLTIAVTPVTATILVNGKQQYKAVALLDDGSTLDVTTNPATKWASIDVVPGTGVASILSSGVATGLIVGQSDITATFSLKISPAARLTVIAPVVQSIVVTPLTATIPVNGTQQFSAVAQLNDGSFLDVTTDPTTIWASASTSVATFVLPPAVTGIATGVAVGTSNITAAFGGKISPAAILTVTAAVGHLGPNTVALGSAGTFRVLAGSAITNTDIVSNRTSVNGDVGVSPGSTVNGFTESVNIVPPFHLFAGVPTATNAKIDLLAAYTDAQSRSTAAISLPGQIGGLTLAPGLYVNSTSSGISGTGANGILTLDGQGDPNAVWIFKMGSTLITDPSTSIVCNNGCNAKNIFWQVGSSATLGTNSIFYGTILADASITMNTNATLHGRALTRTGAVSLDTNQLVP